jgi:hypothetical protein
MPLDLTTLSTEDLLALKAGDLSKVSTEGLQTLKEMAATPPVPAAPAAPPPSTGRVALQSTIKGVAAIPEMLLNTPTNLWNLAKAGYGTAAGVLGRPDIAASTEITPPPNYIQRGLEATGITSPEFDPQTGTQRILDKTIQTGVQLAISPASGLKQVAGNVATGALSGALGGVTKEATGSDLAAGVVSVLTPFAARGIITGGPQRNVTPVKAETLKEAHEAGYVVPPSTVKPTFATKRLESVAGKAAVGQEAVLRNQAVTNSLAKKALGLSDDAILTEESLEAVRKAAGVPYQEVARLSSIAANALERLKQARFEMARWFKFSNRTGDPAAQDKAKFFQAQAETLERVIEKAATSAGQPELVKQLRESRQLIAKSYDVERALNVGTGDVSARAIGRMLDQGKPLTGELKVIGRFAQAFPSVTREAASIPSPGVSGTDAAASALLGTIGYGGAGLPGLLPAGLPLLRGPARHTVLSGPIQNRLVAARPTLENTILQGALAGREITEPR